MKKVLTIALFLAGTTLFAQAPASTTPAQTSTAPGAKATALSKSWILSSTENFGDKHAPTDIQKIDLLNLMEGGHYRLIMNGVAESGTWMLSKDNLWITLTSSTSDVKKFKILESTETMLKVDYRDADDIHNILVYSLIKR
ncbi:MAG: hypothetical protein ABIQ40_15865 [Bacteroidia bacterium]